MRLGRPKTKGGFALTVGAGVVVVAVLAFVVIYFVLFPTSSPKPFSLASTTAAAPVTPGTRLAGRWTVASGSEAGYRVREKLGFLPAESDAVGRTSAITGGATVAESGRIVRVTASSFVIAVNTLKSNEAQRDEHIQTIGLQSATYPKATFVLSDPLTLPASALNGGVVRTAATGILNIHGTAKRVTIPVQMRLTDSGIEAVGSLTFPWGEFNMTAPSVGGFVNVTSTATMEFDLHLARA